MSENLEVTSQDTSEPVPEAMSEPVSGPRPEVEVDQDKANTPEEIAELIAEFEQYRDRLVNETIAAAKKAKLPKAAVMSQLEPELAQIDQILVGLRERHGALAQA